VAVFVDGPVHGYKTVSHRDREAEDRLVDSGWDVVRFPHDADWSNIIEQNPRYFGTRA
jgi:very-short-patch-repair endonuclease